MKLTKVVFVLVCSIVLVLLYGCSDVELLKQYEAMKSELYRKSEVCRVDVSSLSNWDTFNIMLGKKKLMAQIRNALTTYEEVAQILAKRQIHLEFGYSDRLQRCELSYNALHFNPGAREAIQNLRIALNDAEKYNYDIKVSRIRIEVSEFLAHALYAKNRSSSAISQDDRGNLVYTILINAGDDKGSSVDDILFAMTSLNDKF